MSVTIRTLAAIIAASALGYTQCSIAKSNNCSLAENISVARINMDMGTIIVPDDLNIGGTIATREFPNPNAGKINYECDNLSAPIYYAQYAGVIAGSIDTGNKTYATNIKGVGMRLSRVISKNTLVYPAEYTSPSSFYFRSANSGLVVTLIKTESTTGSGSLTGGSYSTYTTDNGTLLMESYLNDGGTTIISSSCKVTTPMDISIPVPGVSASSFTKPGTMIGSKEFSIDMECSGGEEASRYRGVDITFSGTPPTINNIEGALVNEYASDDKAKGIGFRVMKKTKGIVFDEPYEFTERSTGKYTFPLIVRYYQYDDDITPGKVHSTLTYMVNYN